MHFTLTTGPTPTILFLISLFYYHLDHTSRHFDIIDIHFEADWIEDQNAIF